MIYLDNSATSYPKPQKVHSSLISNSRQYSANPGRGGYKMSINTANKIYSVRENLADFFNTHSPDCVAFTLNCTYAINTVLKGILKSGDHVLCSDIEHNCVLRPLEKMRSSVGISYDIFKTDIYNDNATLSDIVGKIKPETKLIICNNASNVFGILNPIQKIGKLCKEKGILFAVDAAQSAGVLRIDMQKMNINFLCIPSHKSLYGIMGAGVLISDGTAIDNTIIEGGTGSDSLSAFQPDYFPDMLESGTLPVLAVESIGDGLNFIRKMGIENIYTHEKELILYLNSKLREMNSLNIYVDYDKLGDFSPIMSFNIKDMSSEDVASELADKGICVRAGYHCSALAHKKMATLNGGTVRISPSFFTTKSEINYTIGTIKKLLSDF